MNTRLYELQQMAVFWAQEQNSYPKATFGLWLHGQLELMYYEGVKEADRVDFNATLKILLDHILPTEMDFLSEY